MSAEPSASLQVFSPPGSGRSSPVPRTSRHAAEEPLYKKDKNFRRYAAGVERTLALWDTAQQEWADYISFLGRLLKALQSHPPELHVIPHSDTVALRLAQCLNPTLPSGVHQKALEVYAYIFSTIDRDTLARDLNLYFPGLAPVLSFASLSVRPLFLSIFEDHILKLDRAALHPALKAIILCLLPGLEDGTSEDFERMVAALDALRKAMHDQSADVADVKADPGLSHFWQCFFLATITNASRRQGSLAYLVRHLPTFGISGRSNSSGGASSEKLLTAEAESAISPEPGLLIRCFEAGLSDTQLLIQRGFLDLIVTHLPLNSPVLQESISKRDLERLVSAAAGVVSRRDMSLNRRLWAWFLGPEPTATEGGDGLTSPTVDPSAHQAAYFQQYGLEALTNSVLRMIKRNTSAPAERARPFRVCLSLMDRWEVGGLLVPEIFLPALQSVQSYSETASREHADEVLRSASAFFDGVDSGLIWGKLIHLLSSPLRDNTLSQDERLQRIKLARFVLASFNLKEEDMLVHHAPLMILATLGALDDALEKSKTDGPDAEVISLALEISDALIHMVPNMALKSNGNAIADVNGAVKVSRTDIHRQIQEFYEEAQGSLDAVDPPFSSTQLGQLTLREASQMFASSIRSSNSPIAADTPAKILANLIFKIQHLQALEEIGPVTIIQNTLAKHSREGAATVLPFTHLSAITSVLLALQRADPDEPYIASSQLAELINPLVGCFWRHCSPVVPKYHVESARCLLQLHTIAPSRRMVEAAISTIIVEESARAVASDSSTSDYSRCFATLWTHVIHELGMLSEKRGNVIRRPSGMGPLAPILSPNEFHNILTRPLLLLLDTLVEEGSDTSTFMRSWLQDLPSLNKVFEILALHIQSLRCFEGQSNPSSEQPKTQHNVAKGTDSKEALYFFKHFFHILKRPSHFTWVTLAEAYIPWGDPSAPRVSYQEWLVRTCLTALAVDDHGSQDHKVVPHIQELHRIAVSMIQQVYAGPFSSPLVELEVEVPLMARIQSAGPSLQSLLLGAELSALKLRIAHRRRLPVPEAKSPTNSTHRKRLSLAMTREPEEEEPVPVPPPPQLIECLKFGFSSPSSRLVLDDWVQFLIEVLPMFSDTIFQNLLPLVECFCKQINLTFEHLKTTFTKTKVQSNMSPESTLVSLINGLEQVLAKAHERLTTQETKAAVAKTPEVPQGFFSNVVSGVFTSEAAQTRTPTANTRLTVLLCFQDTVRICFAIWVWGGYAHDMGRQDPTSASSYGYTSLRMRNRARRILEHLFAAEALECLETLIVLWAHFTSADVQEPAVTGLLNVLNGSKPKHTIPAIFNALYSRTDSGALDANRLSTLTSDLSDTDLVGFLVDYTKSLEDDAMDEIWQDCTLFLRDVLANPLPHRQILPMLLEFTAVIGQKVDNTNFGEQRRMRKELADLFTRILTAIFTTRSMGYSTDGHSVTASKAPPQSNGARAQSRATDVVSILTDIVPKLSIILVENDRVAKAVSDISTSVIGPLFRSKSFPENVTKNTLDLVYELMKVAQTNRVLKKDIFDAFNDPKFFNAPLPLIKDSWLPVLAQWTQTDKERMQELLSRLSAPTTAGIMFGVGATSARQEADRKTQLTLRRIAILILASPEDAFTPNMPQVLDKIVELLAATPASSPSSITRAEVAVLLRAILLRTTPVHLASLWPIVNGELTSALSSILADAPNKEHYNNSSLIQICKLLDELVVLNPDDFQLLEWLFITDTTDAVYKPSTVPSLISLTDEINERLSQSSSAPVLAPITQSHGDDDISKRTLFLDPLVDAAEKEENASVHDMARGELINRIIRPFLGNLAMNAFESRYGGGEADWQCIWESVVKDAAS